MGLGPPALAGEGGTNQMGQDGNAEGGGGGRGGHGGTPARWEGSQFREIAPAWVDRWGIWHGGELRIKRIEQPQRGCNRLCANREKNWPQPRCGWKFCRRC